MFILAIDAGHYTKTAGRRVTKKFDKNQTREWELNNRVALAIEEASKQYEDIKVIRVDDVTGKTLIGLQERCDKANEAGADMYASIHHNAGILGGKGGGITIFIRKNPKDNSKEYMDAIYECCLESGGLKGNRATPKKEKNYHVLKHTKMPAVLTEYGFMDSSTDAPVIIDSEYSKKMGHATMEAIAKVAGLKKNSAEKPEPKEEPKNTKLTINGKWDTATTIRLQHIFGTPVDGKVSNQWLKYKSSNPGLSTGWEWKEKPNGNGSKLIKAMQKWAGMPAAKRDGEFGPETCKAIQRKLGTTVDGKVSNPSQMVKALQEWANNR